MDKPEKLEVGRVIFHSSQHPDCWQIQTLRNHVGNVTELVKLWKVAQENSGHDHRSISCNRETHDLIIQSAEIHDMGKPQRFRLKYEPPRSNKNPDWIYSFAGHRFDAKHDNFYVEALAQLHHEYSVDGITRYQAQLRQKPHYQHLFRHLPTDLYILEMCDQIEASVSSSVLESKQPMARVFMDLQFGRGNHDLSFRIDPWMFTQDRITLEIESAVVCPDKTLVTKIEKEKNDNKRRQLLAELKNQLLDTLQTASLNMTEVELCPWI